MRGAVAREARGLALVVLAVATPVYAQLPVTIDDARLVEQSGGPWGTSIAIRLPGPPPANVTVDWTIVPGSATYPGDFTYAVATGTVTFTALIEDTKYVNLQIVGDTSNEWNTVLKQDETFFIQLSNPSANAFLAKGRSTITILDDDRTMPGVQFLAVAAAGNVTTGSNKLQWRVPAAPVPPNDVLIRWNTGAACASPSSSASPLSGPGSGQGFYVANFGFVMGPPGAAQGWPHTGLLLGIPHCYSLFAYYGGSPSSEIAMIKATPFDSTATAKRWTYTTGAASVVPPTVGTDAIYTVDNDGVVHAMQRGDTGGPWPSTWNPVALGKPAQARSPVVPMTEGWRLFVGTDGGGVHAVDARTGRLIWSRAASFGNALPSQGGVQAPPAGLFKSFGGTNDLILVGTNNGSNSFYALDPATGTDKSVYSNPVLGGIQGMAVADYGTNRVYFGNASTSATFFALDLGPMGAPALSLSPPVWNPKPMGGTSGSLVIRGGRAYVGDSTNQVHALELATGTSYQRGTGDGQVKGFLWPDRRNSNLYFSTTTLVQGFQDTGSGFVPLWALPLTSPSMVLQRPGSNELYVGDGTGRLVRIDVSTGSEVASVTLEPGSQIGPPSLDMTHSLIIVGSATGVIYAVSLLAAW